MSSESIRAELEEELSRLIATEKEIDGELSQYFDVIAEGKSVSTGLSYESSSDLSHSLSKVEQFSPCFEVMTQGSSKLVNQIDECRGLSDRLSMMVRRLDDIQIRAQEALACTEDVINIKDCKIGVMTAIEEHNLPLAVSFIRQVHDIDQQAAKASDDYLAILEAEKEVCSLVRAEFEAAIQSSDIDLVLKLCPLLQTVGLEVEARDKFITFMEDNIFIGVSADAADIDSTDHATAYAQTLASIFNNACLIYQQYLPVVIQGMEKSDGDVVFIRRLHNKCSKESGLVLKRYMKFRNVKSSIAAATASSSVLSRMSNTRNKKTHGPGQPPQPAEMHQILDEIAIILQYCCSYAQYVTLLCKGAEDRPREHSLPPPPTPTSGDPTEPSTHVSTVRVERVRVFGGPCDFDQMVDELINSYYVEGEHWLMLWGIECVTKAVKKSSTGKNNNTEIMTNGDSGYDENADNDSGDFDGCFFVLQRCSQRAVATNNIHAACAVLHFMADHLSNDLLHFLTQELESAVNGLSVYITAVMHDILKTNSSPGGKDSISGIAKGLALTKGLQSVFSSRIGVGGGGGGEQQQQDQDSPQGTQQEVEAMEVFNSVELCARYTTSLRREIASTSREVFGTDVNSVTDDGDGDDGSSLAVTDSLAKINMCLENFDECRECFVQAINNAYANLVANCDTLMVQVLTQVLGEIHFEYEGDAFDEQEGVQMVPKVLVAPFEILIGLCTESLNDTNKDLLIGMLVTAYASSMERFISEVFIFCFCVVCTKQLPTQQYKCFTNNVSSLVFVLQTTFSFAGSIKLEDCVRALNHSFAQLSTVSLRAKFSRLREVLLVLTSEASLLPAPPSLSPSSSGASLNPSLPLTQLHNLSQLSEAEAHSYLTLRIDLTDYQ
jgi:hypothetical protein